MKKHFLLQAYQCFIEAEMGIKLSEKLVSNYL